MQDGDQPPLAERNFVIIGGGPAGLTAAYELTRRNVRPLLFEKLDKVGGIARTENYKGFHFDMGGHRFFTKSPEVNQLWREVLGDDFLRRPRLSRIFYNSKFFYYPLKPFNAIAGLGLWEGFLIVLSYLRWQLFPYREEETFEQWVTNRFGQRLYQTFFKSYTEKVWGIPCSELKAEWAAQRIKDLSLKTAVTSMLLKPGTTIKTLIEEFDYPRRGPGMMWTAFSERVQAAGGTVCLESDVMRIHRDGPRITGVTVAHNGRQQFYPATDVISSMPITEFVQRLDPPAPPAVQQAAGHLHYRDFLTVCLIVRRKELFPDNWIYVHDPSVQVGRIQNFKNWSADMVPDPEKSSLGLEYFCNEGDALWTMPDAELIELGRREMAQIGLARYEDFEDGAVYRVPKSYPIYDGDYRGHLNVLQEFVASLENFQTIGRNGLHRYNNQDHAMLTGLYAVQNVLDGRHHNLWLVNAEDEYHEEIQLDEGTTVEIDTASEVIRETLAHVFEKLDPLSFGLSLGLAGGLLMALATLIPLLRGSSPAGYRLLTLVNQYLPGYTVSPAGALIGLLYGLLIGFVIGWLYAFLRNTLLFLNVVLIQRRAELSVLRRLDDYIM